MTPLRRPAVILNPSKCEDPEATRSEVSAQLNALGMPDQIWLTTTQEDPGRGQTHQAITSGADLVVALGGDGTVRACAAELEVTGTPLGLLPLGTGNLLARNLQIPLDMETACKVVAGGHLHQLDLIALHGEPFAVMAGSGFDAAVFRETSQPLKRRIGWLAYAAAGLRAAAKPGSVE